MTADAEDQGFTGLVWHETHVRGQYEAYHAGCRYVISPTRSWDREYAMYELRVRQPDDMEIVRVYKGRGTAKGCATKLAQRLQWRFRGDYWNRVIAEREQGGHHA